MRAIDDRFLFFSKVQSILSSFSSFDNFMDFCSSLSGLIDKFPISPIDRYIDEEGCQVDSDALRLFPSCVQFSCLPVVTGADGNCLPRALSLLLFGKEDFHVEMRCRLSIALSCHQSLFLSSTVWSVENDPSDVIEFICQVSQFSSLPKEGILQKETMLSIQDGSFMGLWQLFAAAFILRLPLQSLFPDKGWDLYRQFCTRLISPPNVVGLSTFRILWSSVRFDMSDEHWVPNHFVPLMAISRPKLVQVTLPVIHSVPSEVESIVPVVNSFYKVCWNKSVYVAQVLDLSQDGQALVRFMVERDNLYCFPSEDDTSWEFFSIFLQEVILTLNESCSTQRKQWFSCSSVI